MNQEQILETIKNLAKSQGFYGRYLEYIKENPDELENLEKENFNDVVDLVLYIEG